MLKGTIAEQNAFGFWAESGDIGSFDRLMDRLIADEALRSEMGERGYQFLREHYTVDKTAATILKHFDVSESPQARV